LVDGFSAETLVSCEQLTCVLVEQCERLVEMVHRESIQRVDLDALNGTGHSRLTVSAEQ